MQSRPRSGLLWWQRRERAELYARVCEIETLTQAWRSVRRGGGAGVDGQTAAAFEARWPENMAELAADLRERRYHPQPVRRFSLPKPDGGQRPIGLFTLRDRVVQRAVLDVVRPLFERNASPASHGALPGRGVGEALARAERARQDGNTWVARADIRAFFDEVDHGRVVTAFRDVVPDDVLSGLVEEWLAAGILKPEEETPATITAARPSDGPNLVRNLRGAALELAQAARADGPQDWSQIKMVAPVIAALAGRAGAGAMGWPSGRLQRLLLAAGAGTLAAGALAALAMDRGGQPMPQVEPPRGTPQGSPLSPLLATGVLQPLDMALDRLGRVLVRYVDDILLVCSDEPTARRGLEETRAQLDRLDLRLNEGKSCLQPYDAGFSFLGATLPQIEPVDQRQRELADGFQRTGYWRARRLMRRMATHKQGRPSPSNQSRRPRGGEAPPPIRARPVLGSPAQPLFRPASGVRFPEEDGSNLFRPRRNP